MTEAGVVAEEAHDRKLLKSLAVCQREGIHFVPLAWESIGGATETVHETIRKWTEMNARILGAPTEEIESAIERVQTALRHPLLDRARASKRKHREYPVMLRVTMEGDGNRLMEGIIDLAFVEDDAWVVVDFKTDADVSAKGDLYQRQLQWYASALSRLTGLSARAYLLSV